jgi:hypothetical protein
MSKLALQLLQLTSLLGADYSVGNFEGMSPADLNAVLRYYHEKRTELLGKELAALKANRLSNTSLLSSFSASKLPSALAPKLLVQDALIVDDPLYHLGRPVSESTRIEREGMGMQPTYGVHLGKLRKHLEYLSNLAPLLNAGLIHCLPLSTLHKIPDEPPFRLPLNWYRELVPEKAVDFVMKAARVRPMKMLESRLVLLNEENKERLPQIGITFQDDVTTYAEYYRYFASEWSEEEGKIKVVWRGDFNEPVEQRQYDAWIEQSINKTVGARLERIGKEMHLADQIGATYLTESSFEAELLALSGKTGGQSDALAINFLNANAELLNLDDLNSVLRLREGDETLMKRFRMSVEAVAGELKGVDGKDFERRAQTLFEKDIQPQIEEVNSAIRKIGGATIGGTAGTGVALVLGLLTGSVVPMAALLGLAVLGVSGTAVPAVQEYLAVRKQPQFVWHKLKS